MDSIFIPESDLENFSERLRAMADRLRRLPPNHPKLGELIPPLIQEVKAIAAQLRPGH